MENVGHVVLRKLSQMPILAVPLVSTLIFAAFKWNAHYSLLADDFDFAALASAGKLQIGSFSYLFTHRPVSGFLSYLLFQSRLPESSQIQFYVSFFLHALGLCLLIDSISPIGKKAVGLIFLSVLCLYPSFHEVLFMNLTLAWGLGTLAMAIALRSRSPIIQTLASFFAIACLESYVLPLLMFPFLRAFLIKTSAGEKRTPILNSNTRAWALGLALYVLVRWSLSRLYVSQTYNTNFDASHLYDQATNALAFLWGIHFYKPYWFSTILQLLVFLALIWRSKRLYSFQTIALIVLIPFLTTAPMWVVSYYAPRAIHASVVMNLVLMGSLAVWLLPTFKRWQQGALIGLLLIAYGSQLVVIANVKRGNSIVLSENAHTALMRLQACGQRCEFDLDSVATGFHGDWVMPEVSREAFVCWVANTNHISRNLFFYPETAINKDHIFDGACAGGTPHGLNE